MADKSKTIKEATDKELDDLLRRLEKERQVQYIIMDLMRNSKPKSPVDPYAPYIPEVPITVSTEAPIDSMYHVGVRGMRWGVRKSRSISGGSGSQQSKTKVEGKKKEDTSGSKPKVHEDAAAAMKYKKRPSHELSNVELKALTTRLQLEKQYKDLNPSDIKKGAKIVKTLTIAGTTVATLYGLSKTPLANDIKKVVTKKR